MGVTTAPPRGLRLDQPADVDAAAQSLASGAFVAHGFANVYAITTRPDAETVHAVNLFKGRPADQVGSVATTPTRAAGLFDWAALPTGLGADEVLELMHALYALGPFGFRGPAATHIPAHLTSRERGVRTVQLIAPGFACPSNHFLRESLRRCRTEHLYITSANRSHRANGSAEEPAHHRGSELAADLGSDQRLLLLAHRDERAARAAYPLHAPMSTTVLGFHHLEHVNGRRCLVVERHGSLPVSRVRVVLEAFGLGLMVASSACRRLSRRP